MTSPLPATDAHDNASPNAGARRSARQPIDFCGKHVHFVGIGGCGMSGLALMLARRGAVVTGSDQSDGEAIGRLDRAGIPVRVGPAMHSLPDGTELVVYSAAIKGDHAESSSAC